MSTLDDQRNPSDRLREPPAERFVGDVHTFDLAAAAARLRAEPHPATRGHRQIVLFRDDPVSLLLFDFEAGGELADHLADGIVTILVVAGRVTVTAPDAAHDLSAGELVVLRPGVRHSLTAAVASQVLVTIHLAAGHGA